MYTSASITVQGTKSTSMRYLSEKNRRNIEHDIPMSPRIVAHNTSLERVFCGFICLVEVFAGSRKLSTGRGSRPRTW